jgi:hypothetical protein
MIKNWLTSLFGIASIIVALFHCVHNGSIDLTCVQAILVGAGLLAAKDRNVTGGTVPATVEAESRVNSPKAP